MSKFKIVEDARCEVYALWRESEVRFVRSVKRMTASKLATEPKPECHSDVLEDDGWENSRGSAGDVASDSRYFSSF